MSQYGFSIWGFPTGISSYTPFPSVGGKKNHKLPHQVLTLQGAASNILDIWGRGRKHTRPDNPHLWPVCSLPSPAPLPFPSCRLRGDLGQGVNDRPPASLPGFCFKNTMKKGKFEHPNVAKNFAPLAGSPLQR